MKKSDLMMIAGAVALLGLVIYQVKKKAAAPIRQTVYEPASTGSVYDPAGMYTTQWFSDNYNASNYG